MAGPRIHIRSILGWKLGGLFKVTAEVIRNVVVNCVLIVAVHFFIKLMNVCSFCWFERFKPRQ